MPQGPGRKIPQSFSRGPRWGAGPAAPKAARGCFSTVLSFCSALGHRSTAFFRAADHPAPWAVLVSVQRFFRPSCGGSRLSPFQGSRRAGTKEGRAAQKKSGSDLIAPLFCCSRETGKGCPCLFPAAAAAGTEARNKRFPSAAPGGFPFYCARGGHPASPRRGKYFLIRPKTKRKPAACAAGFLQGVCFGVRRNHVQKSGYGFRLSVILIIGAS